MTEAAVHRAADIDKHLSVILSGATSATAQSVIKDAAEYKVNSSSAPELLTRVLHFLKSSPQCDDLAVLAAVSDVCASLLAAVGKSPTSSSPHRDAFVQKIVKVDWPENMNILLASSLSDLTLSSPVREMVVNKLLRSVSSTRWGASSAFCLFTRKP
ncbi:hypothetical protein HDU82_005114 [Entophlyctis luteolus]|nr:hypothetical protein HDU82_005114 [Entophlyctis luteolus]